MTVGTVVDSHTDRRLWLIFLKGYIYAGGRYCKTSIISVKNLIMYPQNILVPYFLPFGEGVGGLGRGGWGMYNNPFSLIFYVTCYFLCFYNIFNKNYQNKKMILAFLICGTVCNHIQELETFPAFFNISCDVQVTKTYSILSMFPREEGKVIHLKEKKNTPSLY